MPSFYQTSPYMNDAGDFSASAILGRNVHRLRKMQGMNKKSFCLMVGISRPLLDKIEKGESDIRISYVQKLAEGLSVHPFELFIPIVIGGETSTRSLNPFNRP